MSKFERYIKPSCSFKTALGYQTSFLILGLPIAILLSQVLATRITSVENSIIMMLFTIGISIFITSVVAYRKLIGFKARSYTDYWLKGRGGLVLSALFSAPSNALFLYPSYIIASEFILSGSFEMEIFKAVYILPGLLSGYLTGDAIRDELTLKIKAN